MTACDGFRTLLDAHTLHEYEEHTATIIGTWPDLTLAFVNQGWCRFAKENDGDVRRWKLGACILDAIPAVLRPFYREHFAAVLREDRPWEHTYECSTPERLRLFHMLVLPVSAGRGLLMVHSLRKELHHDPQSAASVTDEYEFTDGFVHQCAHCRRTRRTDDTNVWDWLPELVRAPRPNTSHGLCQPCHAFYYTEGRNTFPHPISTTGPAIDQRGL